MRTLLLVALTLLIAGCGFKLRGEVALPPEMASTYISYGGGDSETLRTVVRALSLADVRVVKNVADASAVLVLPVSTVSRRVLLKDTQGRPREYEIVISLQYEVLTPEGKTLVPPGTVVRATNVELDPVNPLTGAGDVQRAVEALREEAAWELLQQLDADANTTELAE